MALTRAPTAEVRNCHALLSQVLSPACGRRGGLPSEDSAGALVGMRACPPHLPRQQMELLSLSGLELDRTALWTSAVGPG
jgi:hypothetical protein